MKYDNRNNVATWIVWGFMVGISIGMILHMIFVSTTIIGG